MQVSSTSHSVIVVYGNRDEDDPTLGVREPRVPHPPTLAGGAAATLTFEPEMVTAAARVTA